MPTAKSTGRMQHRTVAAFMLLIPFGFAHAGDTLRECIAQARNSTAVTACEQAAQLSLQKEIKRLSAAIHARLDRSQHPVFNQSTAAWQTFLQHETALQELTLSQREDGLGDRLLPGAITLLYEQRARQLREHLHNLSSGPRAP